MARPQCPFWTQALSSLLKSAEQGKKQGNMPTSRGQLPEGEERTFCSGPAGEHRNWARYNKERKMGRNHIVAYRKRRQTPYDHFPWKAVHMKLGSQRALLLLSA